MNQLDKAIEFAALKHRTQVRKGSDTPYIMHPYGVGMLLQQHGFPEEVVIAGILHDTLEDTDTSPEEIQHLFGKNVLSLVLFASEEDKSLSWEDRKTHTINGIAQLPADAAALVLADKIHNLRTLRRDVYQGGEAVWQKFNRGKDAQSWYHTSIYREAASQSFPAVAGLLNEYHQLINQLFNDPLVSE